MADESTASPDQVQSDWSKFPLVADASAPVPAPVPAASTKSAAPSPATDASVADKWGDFPLVGDRGALSVFGREAGQAAVAGTGEALKGLGVAGTTPGTTTQGLSRTALELALLGPTGLPLAPLADRVLFGQQGTPAQETPVYQAGKAVKQFAEKTFPVTEEERRAHPIASTLGSTAGSVTPIIAASMADPVVGLALGASEFGLGGAGETYDAAKAKGANEKTAREAAALSGGLNAAIGVLPVGDVLKPFMKYLPEATPWAVRKLAQVAENGITFGTIGEAQNFLGQQVAKLYDPQAEYSFDANRLLGELLFGGAAGAIHPTPRRPAVGEQPQGGAGADQSGLWLGTGRVALGGDEGTVSAQRPTRVQGFKGLYPYDWNTGPVLNGRGQIISETPLRELTEINNPNRPYAGFFSSKPEVANRFADALSGGAGMRAAITFDNPLIIDARGKPAAAFQFESVAREHQALPDYRAFQSVWGSPEHDGVILKNTKDEGDVYVPRNPQQIVPQFGEMTDVKAQRPTIAPTFYSAAERAVTSAKQEKASPEQWLGTIKNAAGVKPEEIEWLGLEDWLKEQKGSVTKQQVADYIRANRIEVREVEHGPQDAARYDELEARRRKVTRELAAARTALRTAPDREAALAEIRQLNDLYDSLGREMGEAFGKPTKFGQYTLPGGPLSRDTEILTRTGWQRIDTIAIGAHVLTRRDEGGELEWQAVEAVPTVYAEQLYHFQNQSIDMQVTANHQMVVKRRRRSRQGIFRTTAEKLWRMAECVIPLTGEWRGRSNGTLFGLNAEDVAEFIGWYIAEGSYKHRNGFKNTIQIAQSKTANKQKCERLERLFDRLGLRWKYYGEAYGVGVRGMPAELRETLHSQPPSAGKFVPSFLFTESRQVIEAFLTGLILGDGTTAHQPGRLPRTSLTTKSERLAGGVQALIALTGRRASVRQRKSGLYVVGINRKQWGSVDDAKRGIVPYNDLAYCVTVKNHAIYVRRNGTAAFTGNSNYRELLLTLPQDRTAAKAAIVQANEARRNAADRMAEWKRLAEEKPGSPETLEAYARVTESRKVREAAESVEKQAREESKSQRFTSSHWDEPNVLAHVRFDDRVIDGKKTLHVSEFQSDWHQRARKTGYANLTKLPEGYKVEPTYLNGVKRYRVVGPQGYTAPSGYGDTAEMAIRATLRTLNEGRVPDAPFKTTWPELLLKRMVRYAAENGYDALSWDTGATNADRYDLSKQVDKIDVAPRTDARTNEKTRVVQAHLAGGRLLELGVDGRGNVDNVPYGAGMPADQFVGKPLSDIFGKEVADKIMASDRQTLSGLDLKVGGEGMVGFYDKILPAAANKLGKKFGAKVGEGALQTEPGIAEDAEGLEVERQPNGEWAIVNTDDGMPIGGTYETEEEAQADLERNTKTHPGGQIRVHTLPITDSLRQAATQEGFPLFRRPGAPGVVAHLSEKYTDNAKQIAQAALRIGERMAPQAKIQGVKALSDSGQSIWGAFVNSPAFPHLISWSLERGGPVEVSQTVRHEIIHHLRTADLIRPDEWDALSKAAKDQDWIRKYGIEERYPDASAEQKLEEAIAEHFANWRIDREALKSISDPIQRLVRSAYQRLDLFFRRVAAMAREFLGKNATASDVFSRIESGEVGRRTADVTEARGLEVAYREHLASNQQRAHGGRVNPQNINHSPTPAQARAGNYAKDHVAWHGLNLTIENAKGSKRRGVGKDGRPWESILPANYGAFKRTEGADGDQLDAYLGPHPKASHVYVVDQVDADTGKFDEHKCFLNFGSERQALATYKRGFSDGRGKDRIGKVTSMTIAHFKDWLQHGDQTKPFRHSVSRSERVREILKRHGATAA